MTPEELHAIEARLGAITPGQWKLIRYDHGSGRIYVAGEHDGGAAGERRALVLDTDSAEADGVATAYHEGDREFFFHAPGDVARLVAEVRRMRAADKLGIYAMERNMAQDEHTIHELRTEVARLTRELAERGGA